MKIAIYGGAFNPVHNEHINIALAAEKALGLNKVIFVPSNISPHKDGNLVARAGDRLKMCKKAVAFNPNFEVSDIEIKRGGVSYSFVTCRAVKKLYPDAELYFIMGEDMLENFPYWKEPQEILKCATLAVCARGESGNFKKTVADFHKKFKGDIVDFGYVGKAVSSTLVRTLAALGEDISRLVPPEVRKYIEDNGLYALPEIRGVKKLLTEERWQHTVRVACFAARNCKRLNLFEYDAIVAAALHDCAKYLQEEAEELKGFSLPDGVPENVPPPVMHQYAGAYVAEHTFKIKDKNILNAIAFHTSGRENMSALEKLIFLADLLEEGRDFEGVEDLRKIFARDIDECLIAALRSQLEYLKSTLRPIYPLTKRAYEYLKEQRI